MISKSTVCLWYDGTALDAATFYAETFPDSAVVAVHRAPGDYPAGKQGDVLTVEFRVMPPCLGLNGGAAFKHNEAFSLQVVTDYQAETDRLWNALVGNACQELAYGWCKDKWGLPWQITPRLLTAAITNPDVSVTPVGDIRAGPMMSKALPMPTQALLGACATASIRGFHLGGPTRPTKIGVFARRAPGE